MSPNVTVGVDIGTTSVKALAVDGDGSVLARSRVPHAVMAPEPDVLRHDAKRAWRAGPRKAYAEVTAALGDEEVAGVAVAAMVPSLTAVNRSGVPVLPGLLYGDHEGRPAPGTATRALPPGAMPDAEGFLRWAAAQQPEARGYWPCQAVATCALSGIPAIDTGVTAALGALHARGRWNSEILASLGVDEAQMPLVVPMAEAAGTLPGSDTVITGGTIDALCDQIVAGATEPGDVLVIFGATLIVWAVCEEWLVAPGLVSYPHTTPERFLVGGPSNAGALFVDWARARCCAGCHGRVPSASATTRVPSAPTVCRSGCPMCAASGLPSRTTPFAPTSMASTSARRLTTWSAPPSRRAVSSSAACSTWPE